MMKKREVYKYMFSLAFLVVSIIVLIVVFLICREIICWYWKINEAIGVLREISAKLSIIGNIPDQNPQSGIQESNPVNRGEKVEFNGFK
jgi:hypothetical protein